MRFIYFFLLFFSLETAAQKTCFLFPVNKYHQLFRLSPQSHGEWFEECNVGYANSLLLNHWLHGGIIDMSLYLNKTGFGGGLRLTGAQRNYGFNLPAQKPQMLEFAFFLAVNRKLYTNRYVKLVGFIHTGLKSLFLYDYAPNLDKGNEYWPVEPGLRFIFFAHKGIHLSASVSYRFMTMGKTEIGKRSDFNGLEFSLCITRLGAETGHTGIGIHGQPQWFSDPY